MGSPPCCTMTPTRSRSQRSFARSSRRRPSTTISPASGVRSPVQHSSVVVLPAPFGPSTAVIPPVRAVSVTPSAARREPYRFVSRVTARASSTPTSYGRHLSTMRPLCCTRGILKQQCSLLVSETGGGVPWMRVCPPMTPCLLYTSDAADDLLCVDL